MQSRFYHDTGVLHGIADQDREAGEMQEMADGRAGQVIATVLQGDGVAHRTTGLIYLNKPAGTVFAAAADVYWDTTLNTAAAAGDFYCGKAQNGGAGAGLVEVLVDLNQPPKAAVVVEDPEAGAGRFGEERK